MPVLAVARQHQKPEAAPFAPEGDAQNLQNPVQSAGRARTAGRLLSQPGRLVRPECAGRWAGQLRLPLECMHQPGERAWLGTFRSASEPSITDTRIFLLSIRLSFVGDATVRSQLRFQHDHVRLVERTGPSASGRNAARIRHRLGCSR